MKRKIIYEAFLGCDKYPKCRTIVKLPKKEDEKKEEKEQFKESA